MINYRKRRERVKTLLVDLGGGEEKLEIKYRPTLLTLSVLRELQESESVTPAAQLAEQNQSTEQGGEKVRATVSLWDKSAANLCEMIEDWDLWDEDENEKPFKVPVSVEGLRQANFDLLDMLTLFNAIEAAEKPNPPTPAISTTP